MPPYLSYIRREGAIKKEFCTGKMCVYHFMVKKNYIYIYTSPGNIYVIVNVAKKNFRIRSKLLYKNREFPWNI